MLCLYVIDEVFHYITLIYIWFLISYFSVAMVVKKRIVLIASIIGCLLNFSIIYSIPNKNGQFYYWSYWRAHWFWLDVSPFKKYETKPVATTEEIYSIVNCEIRSKKKINEWKFGVNFQSDRDTIFDFKYLKSYKKGNCRIDLFSFTSFRVPNKSSQHKELFNKEISTFAIISVGDNPKRYFNSKGGEKETLQTLMVDFEFYSDFMTFRWENKDFWKNIATNYSENSKKIKDLKKCR